MLIYFKVGNYKSIKEPVVINFTASSISEHRDTNVTQTKRHSLLRTALLYGHNASGKSKLLEALVVMRWVILFSSAESQSGETLPIEPFLLAPETADQPSHFEVSFCLADQTYRYGFEANSTRITEEWLFETRGNDENPLFLRLGDDVHVSDPRRFENATGLEQRTRSNALFLSVASQWNVQKAEHILNWFRLINTVSGNDDELYKRTTLELMKNAEMAAEVMEFIRRADIGIDAIVVGPPNNKNRRLSEGYTPHDLSSLEITELPNVFTTHQQFDAKGNPTKKIEFMMERQESK